MDKFVVTWDQKTDTFEVYEPRDNDTHNVDYENLVSCYDDEGRVDILGEVLEEQVNAYLEPHLCRFKLRYFTVGPMDVKTVYGHILSNAELNMKENEEVEDNFKKDLEKIINKYSLEKGSGTPDYALANYLVECLRNYENTVLDKDKFWAEP